MQPADPLRGYVEEISKAGNRAASLTRQLLAFSRKQVLAPEVLNLNTVVLNMEKMLRRLIGEDIDLASDLSPSLDCVRVDHGQIEQVIMNLVVNARDAMPRGGKVTIQTANITLGENDRAVHPDTEPGLYVMLAISDTGCGMTAETRSHLFEPFFTTKDRSRGTGLGLATVYGIVKQSGGFIYVYTQRNLGTTVKIYLPRAQDCPEPTSPSSHSESEDFLGTETVLLVEDQAEVRTLAARALKQRGYTVLEALTPAEAVELCRKITQPIDLLLTDVVMPELSGRDLAKRLVGLRPGMKVLYMSGYTDDAVVRYGVQTAASAFLQKPFAPAALGKKVREVLNEHAELIGMAAD
jgi:CheY-like chemotaxis protein